MVQIPPPLPQKYICLSISTLLSCTSNCIDVEWNLFPFLWFDDHSLFVGCSAASSRFILPRFELWDLSGTLYVHVEILFYFILPLCVCFFFPFFFLGWVGLGWWWWWWWFSSWFQRYTRTQIVVLLRYIGGFGHQMGWAVVSFSQEKIQFINEQEVKIVLLHWDKLLLCVLSWSLSKFKWNLNQLFGGPLTLTGTVVFLCRW